MRYLIIWFLAISLVGNVYASTGHDSDQKIQDSANQLLQNLFKDNAKYVKKVIDPELKQIQKGQTPRATVVSCSDSRIQSVTIDDTPINDLFYIRNIGNQIDTSIGSVKYGVQYLRTPVLLIIGHVDCGAVKAALEDYRYKPKELRKELYTLGFPEGISAKDGVIHNIHSQVKTAIELFATEIKEDKLIVLGTLYDFQNEYKQGYNRLILINLNGEKNPKIIRRSKYLKGISNIKIGI